MKISIIIPTYNEQKSIRKCLNSLLLQKYKDTEIIVVDDGSNDHTLEILSEFSNKIKLLKQKHEGAGLARNFGARHATGDILVFVDADMTFQKIFLKKLVAPIVAKTAIGTFSKEEYVSNWNNIWARCWNWNFNLPDKQRLPKNYPEEQKVYRAILRSKFKEVGGFDKGGYTDDWTLSDKLGALATNASGAKFYHENPDTLEDVFIQAKWSAKREYKLGYVGAIVAIVRSSYPVSFFIGVIKSVLHKDFRFLLFKIVYDTGVIIGILSFMFSKNGKK